MDEAGKSLGTANEEEEEEYPADAAASDAVSFRRLPSNSTSRYPTALGIIQLDKFVMICLNFFHRERPKKKIIL